MQLTVCDHCRTHDRPTNPVTVVVVRSVPGAGKKAKGEPVIKTVPLDLCEPCAERLGVSVARLVDEVRGGRFTLPEVAAEDVAGVEDEAPVVVEQPALAFTEEPEVEAGGKRVGRSRAGATG